RQRLSSNGSFLGAQQAFTDKLQPAKTAFLRLHGSLSSGRLDPIEAPQRDVLKGIMIGLEKPLNSFLATHDAVMHAFQVLDSGEREFDAALIAVSTNARDLEALPGIITRLNDGRTAFLDAAQTALG